MCAICLKPSDKRLAVDHDHETDEIRGLLCSPCNFALGLFEENPWIMERAIDYLSAVSLEDAA